jgi:hypothetical protein
MHNPLTTKKMSAWVAKTKEKAAFSAAVFDIITQGKYYQTLPQPVKKKLKTAA